MSDVEDSAGARAVRHDDEPEIADDVDDRSRDLDEGDGDSDLDTSEEEDDDDEEEIAKVRQGFIVDDDEDDNEEEDGEGKKRRKRRRHHGDETEHEKHGGSDEELDQDDLDLLLENTGRGRQDEEKRFKRLKKAGGASRGDGAESRDLTAMFSDDEEEDEEEEEAARPQASDRRSLANEFDDFIEEDEFSDDDEAARRQEEAEIRRSGRRGRKQSPVALSSEMTGIDEEKLGEIFEVFGDGAEYEWALEAEDENYVSEGEGEFAEGEGGSGRREKSVPELKDIFEPSELKSRLLTDEDNAIRAKDVPERYQMLRSVLKSESYELNEADFAEEQQWITTKLADSKNLLFIAKPQLRVPFQRAVQRVVEFVSRDNLEVPFIWHHRRDYLIYLPERKPVEEGAAPPPAGPADILLNQDDLWRIVLLDVEFHGIVEKRQSLTKLYNALDIHDFVYEELFKSASTLVDYQDLFDYLQFKYSALIKDLAIGSGKRHSRFGRFDRIRDGRLYDLVREFGISADQLGDNLLSDQRLYFSEDPSKRPEEVAKAYGQAVEENGDKENGNTPIASSPAEALQSAQEMLAEEIYHDPKVRKAVRQKFAKQAKIDIVLTDKGSKKITDSSPYYDFKYAINRSFDELRLKPELFMRMLKAEEEGLVAVRVSYPDYKTAMFEYILGRFFASDNVSDIANAWNELRRSVLKAASRKYVPLICRNVKEDLKIECQRALYFEVRKKFGEKLNQAPYKPPGYVAGTTARVLTITAGMGDFGKDAILGVLVDEEGQAVEFLKLGDPRHAEFKTQLVDFVNRRHPDVIGIAGFTISSNRLFTILEEIVKSEELVPGGDAESQALEVVWVQDEVARLYQNSERAAVELAEHPVLARYCVALARYLQSPLCEYAALGKEISAIRIHPYQELLPKDMLTESIDSAFVDNVNLVGVEINDVVRDQYQANLLPYVAGLGPRKASSILQGIQNYGGQIANRSELITEQITTKCIFMNCASFLKIPYEKRTLKNDDGDLLDATRIHPEDYELGRKMAADALELDEEDLEAYESSGGVVAQLLNDDPEKLNELILEQYAEELERKFNQKKSHTLEMIKAELQNHYGEQREPLHLLSDMEVFTMLTGETQETLHNGLVVPFTLRRVGDRFLAGKLASGIEGNVASNNMTEDHMGHPSSKFTFGQTVQAVILDVNYKAFTAELSTVERDVQDAVERARHNRQSSRDPKKWDFTAEEAERTKVQRQREQEQRSGRIIKHPLFKLFNSKQAEEYLAPLQRGDVVIRPSSRGNDHIAVTWKVADMQYQHIDVVELGKANPYALGQVLVVGNFRYSDLDELLIMHVQAMARKVDEMVASDKFQKGSRAEVEKWLTAYTDASANRSVYAFCFDHKRPGYFLLCFKTSKRSAVQTWHVKIIPNGYELMNNSYADVPSLCNGFKKIFSSRMQQYAR